VLAALLLGSLGWGTAAEFTHHHGIQTTARFGQTLASATQAAEGSGETATARFQSSGTERSSSTSNAGAECTICQLHRNLSATLFNSPPRIAAPEIHVSSAPARVVFQLSEFTPKERGRAPPSNL